MRPYALCSLLCAVPVLGQTTIDSVRFVDRGASGEIVLGALAGAPSVIDFDNDGYPDLIHRHTLGRLAILFHNEPDPARPGARTFVDVTSGTPFAEYTGTAATPQGALVADYDNDGWSDVYLMGRRAGHEESGRLYRNDGGGGFIDVTALSGVEATGDDPESASWTDYDLDGRVDLFVVSRGSGLHRWRLLRNRADGTFEDVSLRVLPNASDWSRVYSHTWSDFDADGYADCYLLPSTGPVLLHNVADAGAPGGRRLVQVAQARGFTYLGPAPMGIAAADYDNDGDFDIGLSNGDIGVYYQNQSGQMVRRLLMTSIFAWGTLWLDADNDGWLDHYQAGSAGRGPAHNKLFRNLGDGTFRDISPALNDAVVPSQYAVQLDYNNDGRQDIVTVNPSSSAINVSVNENLSTSGHAWVKVRARGDGVRVNADAIGAVIRVRAGGMVQSREVTSGSSTHSTDDLRQQFGLGDAPLVDSVEIVWPRTGSLAQRTQSFQGPFTPGQVLEFHPTCPGDVDSNQRVDSADLFEYLRLFFELDPAADFTNDGTVASDDLFGFLTAWFEGC